MAISITNRNRGEMWWMIGRFSIITSLLLLILFTNRHTTKLKINVHHRASTTVRRIIEGMNGRIGDTSSRSHRPEFPPLNCHILHHSNSCNSVPNYFMYSTKREEIKNAFINFMHVPKSGGTTMKECMRDVSTQLRITEPFLLHTDGRLQLTQDILNGDYHILKETSIFMGDYSFGVCDLIHDKIGDRKCSTFIILREPYERMVSNYYYCRELNLTIPGIPDCRSRPITEWALGTKSILWNEIFTDIDCDAKLGEWTCKMNYSALDHSYLLVKNITYIKTLVEGLDKHFSVIGLTEDMESTLKMLQRTYGLPFYDTCKSMDYNVGNYNRAESSLVEMNTNSLKSGAKRQLLESREVVELLHPEVLLYNRAKEIFNIQKERLDSL